MLFSLFDGTGMAVHNGTAYILGNFLVEFYFSAYHRCLINSSLFSLMLCNISNVSDAIKLDVYRYQYITKCDSCRGSELLYLLL